MENFKIKLASEIIASYKRLSYKVWYALAEFVDNSTQAFENNKTILLDEYSKKGTQLVVSINYFKGDSLQDDYFEIIDNSIGMSKAELIKALNIGVPPENNKGRCRYGLGMKTAAFWLGDEWSIKTKKLDDSKEHSVCLSLDSISGGNLTLGLESIDKAKNDHYTVIKIEKLHRRFKGNSINKIKSFLSSIYRFDMAKKELILNWNSEPLQWKEYTEEDFIHNSEGKPYRVDFEFNIANKKVYGWAGVLKSGGRLKGGFALVQCNRIIQAPPNGYKPEGIFGEQFGGINDLINQRIVGETFLDEFEISHTKDNIVWEGTEEEELNYAITKKIGDFKKIAREFRAKAVDEGGPTDIDFQVAFDELIVELKSTELNDTIDIMEIPPDDVILESNKQIQEAVVNKAEPTIIKINKLEVRLYINETMSPNDPYVITDSTNNEHQVIVIVNKNHPFWNELEGSKGIMNYLRQCVYDGVAEWKAWFMASSKEADTIKYIKDDLLRLPYNIEKNRII